MAPLALAEGRLLALDLGIKRVGVAVSDELRITVRPLPVIERRSWKNLLHQITELIVGQDIKGLVIGLPLRLDGSAGTAAHEVREICKKLERSLSIPVYLQNEALTSVEAESNLKAAARDVKRSTGQIDSEAAAVILRDFISAQQT